jgi:thiamine pyrophosphate-dependent acetolactate synthase large subunit-like protein
VSDAVGEALARAGVDTVFGLIGSGNFRVTAALCAHGASYHAARHEGGAISMADGWARVTGRVGVCSVHQGPGLTNTLTGLTEAVKSRTPLLVLAADTPAAALRSNFRIDQHGLVEAVGAGTERLHSAATAEADVLRALDRARRERRPIVLMLPLDVQAEPVAAGGDASAGAGGAAAGEPAEPAAPPVPAPAALAEAAALLAGAQRPLIVGGRGAVLAGARDALEALGARAGALLATSAPAHGLFAGLPYALGISGGFASPLAAELIAQADVVVAAGARLNHWTTRHGALLAPGVQIVQIDVEPEAIGAHHAPAVALLGDVAAAAGALAELVPERAGWRTPELREAIAARGWRDEAYEDRTAAGRIHPRTLTRALDELLPAERTVAIDSGHFMGWAAMELSLPDARSWVFSNGFQAVGLGLATALGAALARPERLTLAALGDGGALMAAAELETVARLMAQFAGRLLIVVYDDAAYGAEVHHFAPDGHPLDSVRFPDVDLAAMARAAGLDGVTVRSTDDLAAVARWLRAPERPLLVDAKIDPDVCADWLAEAFRGG